MNTPTQKKKKKHCHNDTAWVFGLQPNICATFNHAYKITGISMPSIVFSPEQTLQDLIGIIFLRYLHIGLRQGG